MSHVHNTRAVAGTVGVPSDASFLLGYMEQQGIDPKKNNTEYRRFFKAMYSWVHFSEYFFKDPNDDTKPLRLDPFQKSIVNALQFGYDIKEYPWEVPDKYIPKEVISLAPRQFGKSTGTKVASAAAFCFINRRYQIGTFSINEDRAKELLRGIKYFVETSPFAYMIEDQNKLELIKTGGKVRFKAYPASESCRGEAINMGIVDEAASIEDSVLHGAILYTMRRVGERWILLSTPKGYKGSFVDHYMTAMKTRPIICASVVGTDFNGDPIYCGAKFEQNSDLMAPFADRLFRKYWLNDMGLPRCPKCGGWKWVYGLGVYSVIPIDPYSCSWKTRAQIEKELELAGNTPLARQEILGEIVMEGSAVFTQALLERAVVGDIKNCGIPNPAVTNYVIGMDFGKVHDNAVLCVMHFDAVSGKVVLDFMYTMFGRSQYKTIDYHDIRIDFMQTVKAFRPAWIVPDALGVGDAVVDEMHHDLESMGLGTQIYCNKSNPFDFFSDRAKRKGFIMDLQAKTDLINNLVTGYGKRSDIALPPKGDPEMNEFWEEMLRFGYEVTEARVLRYGTQHYHDDRVIAHALAYWAAREPVFLNTRSVMG